MAALTLVALVTSALRIAPCDRLESLQCCRGVRVHAGIEGRQMDGNCDHGYRQAGAGLPAILGRCRDLGDGDHTVFDVDEMTEQGDNVCMCLSEEPRMAERGNGAP